MKLRIKQLETKNTTVRTQAFFSQIKKFVRKQIVISSALFNSLFYRSLNTSTPKDLFSSKERIYINGMALVDCVDLERMYKKKSLKKLLNDSKVHQ